MVHREQEIKQLQVLLSAFHNAFVQLPHAGRQAPHALCLHWCSGRTGPAGDSA